MAALVYARQSTAVIDDLCGAVRIVGKRKARFSPFDEIANGHICIGSYQSIHKLLDCKGCDEIVTVNLEDVTAGCSGQARISCSADAAVLLVNDLDSGISGSPGLADIETAIGGSVVNEDDLNISIALLHYGSNAPIQVRLRYNKDTSRNQTSCEGFRCVLFN